MEVPLSTETHVGEAQRLHELGVLTLWSSESGSVSPSAANNASTETSGASFPVVRFNNVRCSCRHDRRTIEMGGINIEAGDVARSTEFDYTPRGSFLPMYVRF